MIELEKWDYFLRRNVKVCKTHRANMIGKKSSCPLDLLFSQIKKDSVITAVFQAAAQSSGYSRFWDRAQEKPQDMSPDGEETKATQ